MKNLQIDSHKLIYHLDKLNKWQKGEEVYPLYVAVSPTGVCNHECLFCAFDYLEGTPVNLDKEVMFRLVKELGQLGTRAMFFSGEGEPFINKSLPEIIEKTKEAGIDAAVNTNGVFLTAAVAEKILKNLTFVRVSLNAGTGKTYTKVHKAKPGDFDKVLENISSMAEIKKKNGLETTIGVQCILLNENRYEIVELAKTLKKTGADYLAIKPFLPHPEIGYSLDFNYSNSDLVAQLEEAENITDDSFSVIIRRDSLEKVKGRSYDRCLSLKFMVEIDCNGDVYPCGPYLGKKDMVYGNINTASFEEVWNSEQCKKVMSDIESNLDVHKCMPNCRNDAVNRFLWDLRLEPDHVNYI
jgi:radical SAM protein with 4Fe4S-binding SPASM domain